jgi:hypothetical protein
MTPITKDDVDLHERIASLETKLDAHIDDEEETLASVVRKLDRIELEFSRYRGIVGGILIAISAVVTFLKMFGEDILRFFTK